MCFVAETVQQQLTRAQHHNGDHGRCFFVEDTLDRNPDHIRARVSECLTPPSRSGVHLQRTIFFLGDSHMYAAAPGLMAAVQGAANVVFLGSSFWCGIVSREYIFNDDATIGQGHGPIEFEDNQNACAAINKAVDQALRDNLRSCDLLVLAQRSYASTGNGKLDMRKSPEVQRTQLARYLGLSQLAAEKGASLLLLGDLRELPKAGSQCSLSAALAASCEISVDKVQEQLQVETRTYEELAHNSNIFYFPTGDLFCDHERGNCGAFVPGTSTIVTQDKDHITVEAALYLWPFLCAFMLDSGLLGPTEQ